MMLMFLSLLLIMRAVGLVVGLFSHPVMGQSASSTCFLSLRSMSRQLGEDCLIRTVVIRIHPSSDTTLKSCGPAKSEPGNLPLRVLRGAECVSEHMKPINDPLECITYLPNLPAASCIEHEFTGRTPHTKPFSQHYNHRLRHAHLLRRSALRVLDVDEATVEIEVGPLAPRSSDRRNPVHRQSLTMSAVWRSGSLSKSSRSRAEGWSLRSSVPMLLMCLGMSTWKERPGQRFLFTPNPAMRRRRASKFLTVYGDLPLSCLSFNRSMSRGIRSLGSFPPTDPSRYVRKRDSSWASPLRECTCLYSCHNREKGPCPLPPDLPLLLVGKVPPPDAVDPQCIVQVAA